jgi:hypothetical protein
MYRKNFEDSCVVCFFEEFAFLGCETGVVVRYTLENGFFERFVETGRGVTETLD